jgi:hypothetical protein
MKTFNMCNLNQSILPLIQKGNTLKYEIIKNKVFSKPINKSEISLFKNSLDAFLNEWTGYTVEIKNALIDAKNIEATAGNRVLEYDYAKKFIFSKCDYESVYDLLDGIMQGINDNNMQKPSHVKLYFQHMLDMAFKTESTSISELIDSRSYKIFNLYYSNINLYEIKMFNSIRTYDDMFNREDRIDIYKSACDVLDIILKSDLQKPLHSAMGKFADQYNSSKMWTAIISHVIDYIIYTAAEYASRIYVIGTYINTFKGPSVVTESTNNTMIGLDSMEVSEDVSAGDLSSICKTTDELLVRDINENLTVFGRYNEFLTLIGVQNISPDNIHQITPNENNKIIDSIKYNDVIKLIQSAYFNGEDYYGQNNKLNEFHHNLKYLLTNPLHGLASSENPKNEILHLIRKNDYYGQPKTIATYTKLAEDLYYASIYLSRIIIQAMNELRTVSNVVSNTNDINPRLPRRNGGINLIGEKKHIDECSSLLLGLYKELMVAVHQKFMYIESCINNIHNINNKDLETKFDLNDPIISNRELAGITSIAVPETLRIPMSSQDLFVLTTFEEACLENEILRLTPGFENSLYLSEAGGSKIIEMVISLVQGLTNSASIFFFKNFKPASQWVIKNKDTLLKMNFSKDDTISNVYKYNLDIKSDDTINGISIKQLRDTLKNFNEEEVAKDPGKWISSLYPSEEIYEWFKADEKTAAIKYQNKILFGTDSDKPTARIELSGAELKTEFDSWVNDMTHADTIAKLLVDYAKAIDIAIKDIKKKAIVESAIIEATGDEPPIMDTNDKKDPNNKVDDPKVQINGNASTVPLNEITSVISRTWKPLFSGIIQIFTDEYKNIKAIYQQSIISNTDKQDDAKQNTPK